MCPTARRSGSWGCVGTGACTGFDVAAPVRELMSQFLEPMAVTLCDKKREYIEC